MYIRYACVRVYNLNINKAQIDNLELFRTLLHRKDEGK